MMRRRSSISNSWVEARERASVEARGNGWWVVARSLTTSSFGSPPARTVSMLPGRPGELVFQHGVGARAGLAHAVLEMS